MWNKVSEADRKVFEAVFERRAKCTDEIAAAERNSVEGFTVSKYKKTVVTADRAAFAARFKAFHTGPDHLGQGDLRAPAGDQVRA
ncbi:MAG: hypothetical protein U1F67_12225 [Rubrivivax sp.]